MQWPSVTCVIVRSHIVIEQYLIHSMSESKVVIHRAIASYRMIENSAASVNRPVMHSWPLCLHRFAQMLFVSPLQRWWNLVRVCPKHRCRPWMTNRIPRLPCNFISHWTMTRTMGLSPMLMIQPRKTTIKSFEHRSMPTVPRLVQPRSLRWRLHRHRHNWSKFIQCTMISIKHSIIWIRN